MECNYPKKSKRSPQNAQQLLLCFLNSNPCLKCKMFVRGRKKKTTGAIEAGEKGTVALLAKRCMVGIHQCAIAPHEDVRLV